MDCLALAQQSAEATGDPAPPRLRVGGQLNSSILRNGEVLFSGLLATPAPYARFLIILHSWELIAVDQITCASQIFDYELFTEAYTHFKKKMYIT